MSRRAGRARTPAAPQSPHNANPVAKGLRRTRSGRPTTVPPPLSAAGAGKVRLGDVFDLQMGKTPARARQDYWGGANKWISIADIGKANIVISKTAEGISDKAVIESGIKIVPANTLIMSFKLSIGKTAITAEPMYTNEAIMAFLPKSNVEFDLHYLYHQFSNKDWSLGSNLAVIGLTLNKKSLQEHIILSPPLPTQQRIADELDRLCALKKNAEDRLAILDQIVKSRFVEMFGEESEWPHERIGGILKIERGGSPRPIDKYITDSPEGVNWIKIGDTVPGEIYIEHAKEKILKSGIVKSRKVLPGDFLLSNSMSFGRPYITKIEGYIHDGWLVLRDENKIFEKLFLHQLLSSQYVYKQFAKLASGSTVKNLNKDLVGRVEVPIPPLSLQREFAEFVASVDKLKAALRETVATLDQLYRAKLQKYFG